MMAAEVKYKKTGIDWMPEVPVHWNIVRLKNVTKIVSGATPKSGVSANWDGNINWVTPAEFGDEMYIGESVRKITQTGLQSCAASLVPIGSIIISNRAPIGSLGISKVELCTNQGCKSIIPTGINKYFLYFLMTLQKENLNVLGNGTTFRELSTPSLRNYKIPFPPKEEQDKIASHLFDEIKKITHFIQTKQRFIELLKEQRQSIITNAVTKGIDGGVKMKETGIDWIPSIPENWNKRRLRFLVKITTGKKNTEDRIPDGEYPFYVRSQTIERINSFSFDGVGILTAGDGVGVGKVFHYVNGKFDFHQRVYLFYNINSEIEGEFLFNYLQANMMSELMRYNSKSTVDSIRLPVIKNFLVVFPDRQEQKRILEHIKTETRTLDIAISKAEREIELIKEYREAMIAEAVTGKMKF